MKPRNDKPLHDASSVDGAFADELRARLAPKAPPADFTARVMARVRQQIAGLSDGIATLPSAGPRAETVPLAPPARTPPPRVLPRTRWALVGAIAASITAGVFMSRHGALHTPSPDHEAETQLLLSLQLAGEKINKARDVVLRGPQAITPPEDER